MVPNADIAVVIPTHDRMALLERTLDSVLACERPGNLSIRLFVVENGGKFGAEKLVSERSSWISLEYQYVENGNKSAALNSVLEIIPDCLIIFLDDDVRVHPQLLMHYAKAAGKDKEGRFFGGGLLVDYEKRPPDWLLNYLPKSSTGWHPQTYAPLGRMFFFGANWAAFSRDLMRLGGFDNQFGPGGSLGGTGQETAMQQRLFHAGVKPEYVHEAVVWHYVSESRSSPKWALNRAYRTAISSGFNLSRVEREKAIAGVPLWLIRATGTLSLKLFFALLSGDSRRRFQAKFKLTERLGNIKGARLRYLDGKRT